MRNSDSSLRWQLIQWIEQVGRVDILVGIPCCNNEDTISHVVTMVGRGLAEHFPSQRCAILAVEASMRDGKNAEFPPTLWARILYDFLCVYQVWNRNRRRLVDMLVPLHFGRLSSYCRATLKMDDGEADKLIEEQALVFEQEKKYLLKRWPG